MESSSTTYTIHVLYIRLHYALRRWEKNVSTLDQLKKDEQRLGKQSPSNSSTKVSTRIENGRNNGSPLITPSSKIIQTRKTSFIA